MPARVRLVLLVTLLPLALFAPVVASGSIFLPLLPGALEPLASEDPGRAAQSIEHANFAQSDRLFPVFTDQLAIRDELRAGSLPTWEPKLGLGYPLASGSIAAPTYPPNLVGILTSPRYAAGPLACLALILAGTGALLFLRRLGLGLGAALVGVVAYQLGGFGIANLFYGMKVDAALWLPWSLWAIEGLRERRRWSALALGLSVALSFLAGFVPIAVFHLTVAGAWALVRLTGRRGAPSVEISTIVPRLILSGLAVLGGLAIASLGVLPMAATAEQSVRADRDLDDLLDDSLPASPRALLGLVVQDFIDAPTSNARAGTQPVVWWITPEEQLGRAHEKANSLEWNLFVGAGVVALALVGLLCDRRRALFPALALLLTIGFAQSWTIVQPLFSVPGLNVGSPARILSLAWFLWPWLAALGVDALARGRALGALVAIASLGTAAFAIAAFWLTPKRWAEGTVQHIVTEFGEQHGIDVAAASAQVGGYENFLRAGARLQDGFAAAAAALAALLLAALCVRLGEATSTSRSRALRALAGAASALVALSPILWIDTVPIATTPIVFVVGTAALGLVALGLLPRALVPEGRWLPIALVLAIEGLLASSGHVTARKIEGPLFPDDSPALQAVRETSGEGRVLRYDPTGASHVENLARPNFLQPYGVGDLCSWIVFTPRTLVELAGAIDQDPAFDMRFRTGISAIRTLEHIDHPLFDAWNVTCVLSRDPIEHPRLTETFASFGFHVYAREGALGPARLVGRVATAPSDAVGIALVASRAVDPKTTVVLPSHVKPGRAVDVSSAPQPTVERPSKRRLDVTLEDGPGGWLVVSEQWAPGWRASIDGEAVDVERADHTLRAVRVPPGPVTVRFVYAPAPLELGALLAVLGLLGLLFVDSRLVRARS